MFKKSFFAFSQNLEPRLFADFIFLPILLCSSWMVGGADATGTGTGSSGTSSRTIISSRSSCSAVSRRSAWSWSSTSLEPTDALELAEDAADEEEVEAFLAAGASDSSSSS